MLNGALIILLSVFFISAGSAGGQDAPPPPEAAPNARKSEQAAAEKTKRLLDVRLGRILLSPSTTAADVDAAIKDGADVNRDLSLDLTPETPNLGMTPLMVSLTGNPNPDIVQVLLNMGADPNVVNVEGKTPIMYAITLPNPQRILTAMIRAGADVNAVIRHNGQTPLMLSIAQGANLFVIDTLVKSGADVNARDIHSMTPLMYASEFVQDPIVTSLLINSGAEVNAQNDGGETALVVAIRSNPSDAVVRNLLRLGADPSIAANNGTGAYETAVARNRTEIVKLLAPAAAKAAAEAKTAKAADGETGAAEEKPKAPEKTLYRPSNLGVNDRKLFYLASKETTTPAELRDAIKKVGVVNLADKNSNTPLLIMVANNPNIENIKVLLDAKADVNAVNAAGEMPITAAAKYAKSPEIIALLAGRGAHVNVRAKGGVTPLMMAMDNPENGVEIMKVLLTNGADVNAKDETGKSIGMALALANPPRTELLEMVLKSNLDLKMTDHNGYNYATLTIVNNSPLETVAAFIKAGVDLNIKDRSGETPIELAARHSGNPEVIKLLVKSGQDVNYKGRKGTTPLMIASGFNKNEKIVETLIEQGANVNTMNENEESALLIAIQSGSNPRTVRSLIKAGANINVANRRGDTALSLAQKIGKTEFANILSGAGAKASVPMEKRMSPADEKLVKLTESKDSTLLQYEEAFTEGADANAKRLYNVTPFMLACTTTSDPKVIKLFLDNRASLSERDEDGQDALMHAARLGSSPEVIKMLIENGAAVTNEDKQGNTALAIAAAANPNIQIIDALIQGGSAPNRKNKEGMAPLMTAVLTSNIPVIEALLKNHADVNVKSNDGATPLIAAIKSDAIQPKVAELLLQYNADPLVRDKTQKNAFDYAKNSLTFKETPAYETMMSKPSGVVQEILNKALLTLVRDPEVKSRQINQIIEAGANPNATSKDNFITFSGAIAGLDPKLARDLLRLGGLPEDDASLIYTRAKDDEGIPLLTDLKNGGIVFTAGEIMITPLMLAATYSNDPEVISALLKAGADAERKDTLGNTALMYGALANKNEAIIKALLEVSDKNAGNQAKFDAAHYIKQNEVLKGTAIAKEFIQ